MIQKHLLKSMLLSTIICFAVKPSEQLEAQTLMQNVKSGIGECISFLISSGDASQENIDYAQVLAKTIDPESDAPKIKKMGKVAQYLLGYKNTLAIPGINYLYINEKWINKLSEEQKRFVIGRGLTWLENGAGYLAIQTIFEAAQRIIGYKAFALFPRADSPQYRAIIDWNLHKLANGIINDDDDRRITNEGIILRDAYKIALAQISPDETAQTGNLMAIRNLINLVGIYVHRATAYDADKRTIEKLDCANGAMAVIADLQAYESDGTVLGELFSTIPVAWWASWLLKWKGYNKTATIIDVAGSLTPGRLHNTPSSLGYSLKSLPLVNYFSRYPGIKSRMRALDKFMD